MISLKSKACQKRMGQSRQPIEHIELVHRKCSIRELFEISCDSYKRRERNHQLWTIQLKKGAKICN